MFGKGKTFLINKLFDVNLPSGKLFETEGFCFFWDERRRMLVLDSAGCQATVCYRAESVQPILDARATESLAFDMISRMSSHVIFVVNDFTWLEEQYVAMLHQMYVQQEKSKELIVIHNLRLTSIVCEAKEQFNRQITPCYDGVPSHLGGLIYTTEFGDDVP